MQLISEMEYAKTSYAEHTTQSDKQRQEIIKNKLKGKSTVEAPLPYI